MKPTLVVSFLIETLKQRLSVLKQRLKIVLNQSDIGLTM